MSARVVSRTAAVLVAAEGVGLCALVLWQVIAIFAGDTDSLVSALALVALTAVGAAIVVAFAVGIWRGRSWGRSGGIVTQALILAVALGEVTGEWADPAAALTLAVPAIVVLVVLIAAVRADAREQREADDAGA